MLRLAGKNAIVTGAGSGIGRATALLFAREGARVALVGRRLEPLEDARRGIEQAGGEALVAAADISREHECRAAIEAACGRFGRIDVLVNNAGVVRRNENVALLDEKHWDEHLAINLKGVFLMCKAAVASMRTTGGGSIVNVASMLGFVAAPGYGSYCAAKGGVLAYTRALALDLARAGIRVNAVCPGLVETPLAYVGRENFDALKPEIVKLYPLGRLGQPEDVAPSILFLASDEASWITGAAVVIDGGYSIR